MTRQKDDPNSGTQFGQWLRDNEDLRSGTLHKGFAITNIDYLVLDCETGKWMLVEEKRGMSEVRWTQIDQFKRLHLSISSPLYHGFHILQFENSTPDDGRTWLDSKKVGVDMLTMFLAFRLPTEWYATTWRQLSRQDMCCDILYSQHPEWKVTP